METNAEHVVLVVMVMVMAMVMFATIAMPMAVVMVIEMEMGMEMEVFRAVMRSCTWDALTHSELKVQEKQILPFVHHSKCQDSPASANKCPFAHVSIKIRDASRDELIGVLFEFTCALLQ